MMRCMLRRMLIYILAVLLIVSIMCMTASCSKSKANAGCADAYDFPVKGGTEEWKALNSFDKQLKTCQIPADILKNMSTEGLVETVLNYPLRMNFIAYGTPRSGIEAQINQFNGLSELLKRPDAGRKLLIRYQQMSPPAAEKLKSGPEKGNYAMKLAYLEAILTRDGILSHLTENELHSLLEETEKTLHEKEKSKLYSEFNKNYTVWLMGKVLWQKVYLPFVQKAETDKTLKNFLNDGFYADRELLKVIEEHADQYLLHSNACASHGMLAA